MCSGLQLLPLKVPQELQNEAQSSQGAVDQSVQEAGWQRACRGLRSLFCIMAQYDHRCLSVRQGKLYQQTMNPHS